MNIRLNTDTGLLKLIAIVTMLDRPHGRDPLSAVSRHAHHRAHRLPDLRLLPDGRLRLYARYAALCAARRAAGADRRSRCTWWPCTTPARPCTPCPLPKSRCARRSTSTSKAGATPAYCSRWRLGLILLWSIRDRHLVITAATLLLCVDHPRRTGLRLQRHPADAAVLPLLPDAASCPCRSWPASWSGGACMGGSYQLFGVRFATQMFALLALPFHLHPHQHAPAHQQMGVLPVLSRASGAHPRAGQAGGLCLRRQKRRRKRAYRSRRQKDCAPGRDIPGRFSVLNSHVPWLRGLLFQRPAVTVGHVVDQTDRVFGAGGVQLDLRDAIALRSVFRELDAAACCCGNPRCGRQRPRPEREPCRHRSPCRNSRCCGY